MNKNQALSDLRKIEVYALSTAPDRMTLEELRIAFDNLYNYLKLINETGIKKSVV